MYWTTQLKRLSLSVITAMLVAFPIAPAKASVTDQVRQMAEQITVRVLGPGSPGSGVIIARQGTTYTVLSANHVFSAVGAGDEVDIRTYDGILHRSSGAQITPLGSVDLALVTFVSGNDYEIATFSNYTYQLNETRDPTAANSTVGLYRIPNDQSQHYVFVSGWPNIGEERFVTNPGILIDVNGAAVSDPSAWSEGYEIVYTNLTHRGMSGGPVLDTTGRLVGIHGLADGRGLNADDEVVQRFLPEGADLEPIKIGYSLAVPITTFLQQYPSYAQLDLRLDSSAPPQITGVRLEDSWTPPLGAEDPNNPMYWLSRGNQLWRLNQFEAAQQSLDESLERALLAAGATSGVGVGFYYTQFAKGFVYLVSEQYDQALTSCSGALRERPGFYYGHRCKAAALYNLRQFPEALNELNQAIQIAESQGDGDVSPNDYMVQGELLFALGQNRGALAAVEQAIVLRRRMGLPDMAAFSNTKGLILIELGDYDQALQELDNAIRLDPEYISPLNHKALALKRMGQQRDALNMYNQALLIDPNDVYTLNNRGVLLYESGDVEEALNSICSALAIDSTYEPAQENYAQIKANAPGIDCGD